MYGPYGAHGCFAGYAGSPIYQTTEYAIYRQGLVQGQYGFIPLVVGAGLAMVAAGGYVSAEMAKAEAAKHTGGTVTLPSGEVVSADEAHARLCDSGVLTPKDCLRSPSEEGAFWADVPQGFPEIFTESVVGYEGRKKLSGECEPDAAGNVDPRCNFPEPEPPKIAGLPAWVVLFGGAAAVAALIVKRRRA